jgi:glutathione S-transferase
VSGPVGEEVELYSIAVCPFAQRTRILLALKGVPFRLTEIDITVPRPDWFLAMNPLGQVPVIRHQGRVLNESSVINEYLEEVFPEPRVFPEDAYQRAQSRILIDKVNQALVPAMYGLLLNQDPARHAALAEKALEAWRWLDAFLRRHNPDGTWLWEEFGMADLSTAPFFQRWCLNAHFRRVEPPDTPDYARVRRWRDAMLAHPLVVGTGMPDADFIRLYADYALGFGNGAVPPGHAHSSFDLRIPLASRPMPAPPAWIDAM